MGRGQAAPPTGMYRPCIFNGPFFTQKLHIWDIKQFVIEVVGFLLACIPGLGLPSLLSALSPPPAQADTTFQVPACPWGGSDFAPDSSQSRPPSVLASPYLPPNDRRRAPQMGHPQAQPCLCLIIKGLSPGAGILRPAGFGLRFKGPGC